MLNLDICKISCHVLHRNCISRTTDTPRTVCLHARFRLIYFILFCVVVVCCCAGENTILKGSLHITIAVRSRYPRPIDASHVIWASL